MENREFGNFAQNTGSLVCSGCKFPDSKGKSCYEICSENLRKFLKLDNSAKSVYVILMVTNHVKWHRENLLSDRENAGNLRMQHGVHQ